MEEYTLDGRLLTLLAQPLRIEEIRRALPDIGKHELKDALDRLTQDGKIMKNKKNRFAVASHYGCATGTFLATERGFAFVAPDVEPGEPKTDDYFIPPNAGGGAWHGDRVLVKVSERKNNRGRREATVLRVLSRSGKELTGELVQRGKAFFVQPSSKKYPEIAVSRRDIGDAQVGDCVAVEVTSYGDDTYHPQGVVSAALGENGTMEASIAAILHENGVFDVFPDEVLKQADSIPQQVDLASAGKRLDLRDKLIFTKSDKDLSGTVKKDREAAEKEEEIDEAVEDDDVQSVEISPAVTVADDDLCTITITEKFKDDWGDIGFVVNITNKSDKDLTFYAPSGKTNVNGTMKEPWFSAHLMPGTNATEEFTFSKGTLDSLDDLVNTTIGIDAYLTDSYEDVASYSATIA